MDTSYEEALLEKQIEFAKRIRQQLDIDNSVAARSVELYNTILDGTFSAARTPASCVLAFTYIAAQWQTIGSSVPMW